MPEGIKVGIDYEGTEKGAQQLDGLIQRLDRTARSEGVVADAAAGMARSQAANEVMPARIVCTADAARLAAVACVAAVPANAAASAIPTLSGACPAE